MFQNGMLMLGLGQSLNGYCFLLPDWIFSGLLISKFLFRYVSIP
jgi:hypothetical protein